MNAMELTLCLLVVAGLFWVRRYYVRKATSNAPDNHPRRLARIRNASLVFQIFIGISYLFVLYWVLAFLMGWPFFAEPKVRIVISHSHIYTAPADMPPIILTLYLLKTALGLWGAAVLFALFRLYGQGILFTARNVRHLRFLGYWLMLGWAIDYQPKTRSYASTGWVLRGLSEPIEGIIGGLTGEQPQKVALGFQLRRSCGQPRPQPFVAAF